MEIRVRENFRDKKTIKMTKGKKIEKRIKNEPDSKEYKRWYLEQKRQKKLLKKENEKIF